MRAAAEHAKGAVGCTAGRVDLETTGGIGGNVAEELPIHAAGEVGPAERAGIDAAATSSHHTREIAVIEVVDGKVSAVGREIVRRLEGPGRLGIYAVVEC